MTVPRATVRLQLHSQYTFSDAVKVVPYYAALGISHFYLSPISRARQGSTHGYDVVDYGCVSPELGGESGFRDLVACLRQHQMGVLLDIVPNHMAAHPANPWWYSILRDGPKSRFAQWFDIQWSSPSSRFTNQVLLPVLADPYGCALARGDIQLVYCQASDEFKVAVSDLLLPLAPGAAPNVNQTVDLVLQAHDPSTSQGRTALHKLLQRQHYRLAWWRSAAEQINWRRFFDINELVGICVEREDVFDAVHALPLRLFAEGLIDGVRVDHVDGMAYPLNYCRRLREALRIRLAARPQDHRNDHPWLVVEKILAHKEYFDERWEVDGDTGYSFMEQVNALAHDPTGAAPLTRLWENISQDTRPVDAWVYDARRYVLDRHFPAQRQAVIDCFHEQAQIHCAYRDIGRFSLGRAVEALLLAFPTYRSYVGTDLVARQDLRHIARARLRARARLHAHNDRLALMALHKLVPTRRFQQLTPPLAAKALEDTVFYQYGRLLSRNEVGADPALFSLCARDFHQQNIQRAARSPWGLLATATHDHKRGEDVRARLAVLSEAHRPWASLSKRVIEALQFRYAASGGVQRAQRYMLLQTIVGAWPVELRAEDTVGQQAFFERLDTWQLKALREGKQISSWYDPVPAAEQECRALLSWLLLADESRALRGQLRQFVECIAPAGIVNSLAQLVLRCTSPGVPDLYQGTSLWDFSLVDPDNRRPVDVDLEQALWSNIKNVGSLTPLLAQWHNAAVKQAVLARCLHLRRKRPELFTQGHYHPVLIKGKRARHALAYYRAYKGRQVLVVVSRFAWGPMQQHSADLALPLIPPDYWEDTVLVPSNETAQTQWHHIFTGEHYKGSPTGLALAALLARFPVAVLVNELA